MLLPFDLKFNTKETSYGTKYLKHKVFLLNFKRSKLAIIIIYICWLFKLHINVFYLIERHTKNTAKYIYEIIKNN